MFTKTFIQERGNGKLDHESGLVAQVLNERGVDIELFTSKQIQRRTLKLDRQCLLVGDVDSCIGGLKQLSLQVPVANDYPTCLNKFLHRKVWQSSLGALREAFVHGVPRALFVKPAQNRKLFTGFVINNVLDLERLAHVSKNEKLYCAEKMDWQSEYRAYVMHNKMLSLDFYAGDAAVSCDQTVLGAMIQAMSGEGIAAYAIDVGVMASGETALIEYNDAFALGAYQISASAYTDLLSARWQQLMGNEID